MQNALSSKIRTSGRGQFFCPRTLSVDVTRLFIERYVHRPSLLRLRLSTNVSGQKRQRTGFRSGALTEGSSRGQWIAGTRKQESAQIITDDCMISVNQRRLAFPSYSQ